MSPAERQRAALIAISEQVDALMLDLLLMSLGLACVAGEVADALADDRLRFDGLGADPC